MINTAGVLLTGPSPGTVAPCGSRKVLFTIQRIMWHIKLLGRPVVSRSGQVFKVTPRRLSILTVLALEGPMLRSQLADLLWDESAPETARLNLRVELHRMRQDFAGLLQTGEMLSLPECTTDVDGFLSLLQDHQFEAAIQMCAGELLQGWEFWEGPSLQNWLELHREKMRQHLLWALQSAAQQAEHLGAWQKALQHHRQALRINPYLEHHHQGSIRCQLHMGERQEALRAYQRCQALFREDLGMLPLPDTTRLVLNLQGR